MPFAKATDKSWLAGRSKYPTGYCSTVNKPEKSQGHEGTSPVSLSGIPMRICTDYLSCPCKCHHDIDQMYSMMGMERPEPEQSPAYLAYIRQQLAEFQMPDVWESPIVDPLSIPEDINPLPDDERPVTVPSRPALPPLSTDPRHGTVRPGFTPTPTGRRARGQLEYDVLTVCDEFVHDVYEWKYCLPKLVAERIAIMNQTEAPSTGAINAVWDRWEKMGFAKQDKKPSRFVEFVVDGSHQTLEMMKRRVKGERRRSQAELKRGSLRPPRIKR